MKHVFIDKFIASVLPCPCLFSLLKAQYFPCIILAYKAKPFKVPSSLCLVWVEEREPGVDFEHSLLDEVCGRALDRRVHRLALALAWRRGRGAVGGLGEMI